MVGGVLFCALWVFGKISTIARMAADS
jgi:hypothetical protein